MRDSVRLEVYKAKLFYIIVMFNIVVDYITNILIIKIGKNQ